MEKIPGILLAVYNMPQTLAGNAESSIFLIIMWFMAQNFWNFFKKTFQISKEKIKNFQWKNFHMKICKKTLQTSSLPSTICHRHWLAMPNPPSSSSSCGLWLRIQSCSSSLPRISVVMRFVCWKQWHWAFMLNCISHGLEC